MGHVVSIKTSSHTHAISRGPHDYLAKRDAHFDKTKTIIDTRKLVQTQPSPLRRVVGHRSIRVDKTSRNSLTLWFRFHSNGGFGWLLSTFLPRHLELSNNPLFPEAQFPALF